MYVEPIISRILTLLHLRHVASQRSLLIEMAFSIYAWVYIIPVMGQKTETAHHRHSQTDWTRGFCITLFCLKLAALPPNHPSEALGE